MADIWTHQLLNALRQIGDPELDRVTRGQPAWARIPAMGSEDAAERKALADVSGMAGLLEVWRASEHGALPGTSVAAQGPGQVFRASADALQHPYWSTPARGIAPDRVSLARELFVEYGGEIGATLLLASLPHAYASAVGASVLANTDELRSNTRRRIGETAQFVVEVLFPEPSTIYEAAASLAPPPAPAPSDQGVPCGSAGYVRTRTTRLTHAVIRSIVSQVQRVGSDGVSRSWRPDESAGIPAFTEYEPSDDGQPNPNEDPSMVVRRGVPINQEDLLGTLATFTVTVFDVMELLGVPWSTDAEQAYLDLWNQVGELLGIGTSAVTDALAEAGIEVPDECQGALRPRTPDEARALAELIKLRSWPLPLPGRVLGPFTGANGKILLRALLDELQAAMPRGMERVPLVVMRYLVDPRAHELLGLGGGGVLESLMRIPTPDRLGRRPARRRGRELVQASMRFAANDISRRAFVYFIQQKALEPHRPQFRFAGIEELITSVPTGRHPVPGGAGPATATGGPAPISEA
jgi:hypothetical protein